MHRKLVDDYRRPCQNCSKPACRPAARLGEAPDLGRVEGRLFRPLRELAAQRFQREGKWNPGEIFLVVKDPFHSSIRCRGQLWDEDFRRIRKRGRLFAAAAEHLTLGGDHENQGLEGLGKSLKAGPKEDMRAIEAYGRAFHCIGGQSIGVHPTRLEEVLAVVSALRAGVLPELGGIEIDPKSEACVVRDYLGKVSTWDMAFGNSLRALGYKDRGVKDAHAGEGIWHRNSAAYLLAELLSLGRSRDRLFQPADCLFAPIRSFGQYRSAALWIVDSDVHADISWITRRSTEMTLEEVMLSQILGEMAGVLIQGAAARFTDMIRGKQLQLCRRFGMAMACLWDYDWITFVKGGSIVARIGQPDYLKERSVDRPGQYLPRGISSNGRGVEILDPKGRCAKDEKDIVIKFVGGKRVADALGFDAVCCRCSRMPGEADTLRREWAWALREVETRMDLFVDEFLAGSDARRWAHEFRAATKGERAFMHSPRVKGWSICARVQQCSEVGGDFCLVTRRPNGTIVAIVGDVKGHGVGAALVAREMIAGAIHLVNRGVGLARIARDLNDYLVARRKGMQSTLFIAKIYCRSGRMVSVNAGHPLPLVLAGRGGITECGEHGPLLGAGEEEAKWDVARLVLAPGEMLLVMTDGVYEYEGEEIQLNDESLGLLISNCSQRTAKKFVEQLRWSIRNHYRRLPWPKDDATLVAIKRQQ